MKRLSTIFISLAIFAFVFFLTPTNTEAQVMTDVEAPFADSGINRGFEVPEGITTVDVLETNGVPKDRDFPSEPQVEVELRRVPEGIVTIQTTVFETLEQFEAAENSSNMMGTSTIYDDLYAGCSGARFQFSHTRNGSTNNVNYTMYWAGGSHSGALACQGAACSYVVTINWWEYFYDASATVGSPASLSGNGNEYECYYG